MHILCTQLYRYAMYEQAGRQTGRQAGSQAGRHCVRDQTLARDQTQPFNAQTTIWGNLPNERIVVFKPPFTITGVDFFVPVTIKQYNQTKISNNK